MNENTNVNIDQKTINKKNVTKLALDNASKTKEKN
jgi:hypothetical protein